ncbi:MAG: molybdopterin biosynthesis protein, partial [Anaerolineaceae bacterium]|nr:molybdopterin biosynthesis protein [Anaerolineaceae bacterium]
GEDIVATQLVLPAGHILRPVDLGAIAACGHDSVAVVRKPKITVIPTGTELIPVGEKVTAGNIIEFNSIVLASMVNGWGGSAQRHPIVVDDFDLIQHAVLDAARNSDLILLNAGSSAGSEDFSSRLVEENGTLLVHGVAVRPGHPVILGLIRHPEQTGKMIPIIGVPGYPVSAALTGEVFVRPIIERWLGNLPHAPLSIQAKLTHKVNSPAGDDDYLRVVAARVGTELLAAPLPRGAGVINSLVKADGIVIIPRGEQGIEAGSIVTVHLYNRPEELEKTIFISGSHDLSLDILADEVSRKNVRVVTSNVGSLGGLVSLRRGEAHGAGSHLLDPETGKYNLSYIRKYCPDQQINVFHWVERVQGLIVPKGNPRRLKSLLDLPGSPVRFVNRQRGAGTRVLLDYQLANNHIDPNSIQGYDQEEFTHLAVAAAVSSGRADCGLGIAAAASALDLDFIPLFNETYELLIPEEYLDHPLMKVVLETARKPEFRKRIVSMPGYKAERSGELRISIK